MFLICSSLLGVFQDALVIGCARRSLEALAEHARDRAIVSGLFAFVSHTRGHRLA